MRYCWTLIILEEANNIVEKVIDVQQYTQNGRIHA